MGSDIETLHQLFLDRVENTPDRVAYQFHSRKQGLWVDLRWRQIAGRVELWKQQLSEVGVDRGERLAILLENSPDWIGVDQAALSLGMVTVPLFFNDRAENMAYVITHSGAKILILREMAQWGALQPLVAASALERVILISSDWESSVELRTIWQRAHAVQAESQPTPPNDLATIIYTSGTTGNPKGVMLSHGNILENSRGALSVAEIFPGDTFLSFLPLSHALERTVGCYLPMMAGATVAFARSAFTVQQDLQDIQPTVLITVPRLFEKVNERLEKKLADASGLMRWLVRMAERAGITHFLIQQGRARWGVAQLLYPLLDLVIGRKVRAALGGRLRIVVSGGAPLISSIADRFLGFGIPILQGYGLTECGPVVSSNHPEANYPDSVGEVLPKTELKIKEDGGELLVRGPGIMLGYWGQPEETDKVIDSGKWLHTGDVAEVRDNHLYITGRIKDILVLSNGEKISPADIEIAILQDPYIDQVIIAGEGRPFLSALVVVNEQGRAVTKQELSMRISSRMASFPGYAKVKRLIILNESWTIEQGLVTPTMKLRRERILEYYQENLDELYN